MRMMFFDMERCATGKEVEQPTSVVGKTVAETDCQCRAAIQVNTGSQSRPRLIAKLALRRDFLASGTPSNDSSQTPQY